MRAFVPLVILLLAAALVAGCGSAPTTPATPDTTASPSGIETPPPSEEPPPTLGPTGEPTAVPTDEPTAVPTDEPTGEPTAAPTPALTPGGANACTGNAENRAFYEAVAGQVAWNVYCPVLPAGWFVDAGSFRLAAGGKLEISYKGPGGLRLELREGAICAGQDACPASGTDAGPASFGGMAGRLLDGGGTWLVVVDGSDADWEAKGLGMDGPTLTDLTRGFALVGE